MQLLHGMLARIIKFPRHFFGQNFWNPRIFTNVSAFDPSYLVNLEAFSVKQKRNRVSWMRHKSMFRTIKHHVLCLPIFVIWIVYCLKYLESFYINLSWLYTKNPNVRILFQFECINWIFMIWWEYICYGIIPDITFICWPQYVDKKMMSINWNFLTFSLNRSLISLATIAYQHISLK